MWNEKLKGIFKAIQLPLSLTLLLTLLLVSGLALTQASATANVSIGDLSCVPGATVTAPILITNVENYGTGTITLKYNPSVVHVTDVTNGPQSTLAAPPNIDNISGIVNISAWNSVGVSGDIIFANVTFKAVGSAGSTPLNLSIITLQNTSYKDIPVIIKNGSFTILPPTPFFICGYVFYENGSECYNPKVNVTNLNASNVWNAETQEGYNYYQLMLSHGIDINTSEVLQFNVTSPDGSQSNITEHTVTLGEVNNGGLFNFNISLEAPAPTPILVVYTISNRTIIPPQTTEIDIKFSEKVKWKIAIENDGTVYDWTGTSINPTKKIWNGTYETNGTIVPDGIYTVNITWRNTTTGFGGQNNSETITVSSTGAPNITHFAPPSPVTNNESESRTFNITIDQTVNVSWQINGTEVFNQSGVNFSEYTNSSAVAGYWNVTAYVYNANGSDIQTWRWTVNVNDTTPPTVISHAPTGTNVPVTTIIMATFDEPMTPSTLNNATIIVENSTSFGVTGVITYDSATRTVTFNPVTDLEYNETYEVTITTGVQDLAGNNMTSDFSWNFTTAMPSSTIVYIAAVSAPPGGCITVPIMINNVTDLGGGEINVTYNSSIVHATNVTEGDMTLTAHNINNASGWVYLNAISTIGQSGDVVFANINLTAVGNENEASPLNITVIALFDIGCNDTPHTVSNGTFTIADTTKPVPSNIDVNATEAGMPVLFSVYWIDDVGLTNYTFAWNDSGAWTNDMIVEMTGTPNWSNVTKTLNSTPKTIGWRIYCNDTSGNLNDTGIQILRINDTTEPVLSNVSANPPTILNDNGRARPPGTNVSRLNITVTDTGSGILNVTINLSAIGGSPVKPMTHIAGTNNWTVSTNASSGINETNYLFVNATDKAGNSNTSVCISLTVLRRGDVYRDNSVSMKDVLYIARYRAQLEPEWSNPPTVLVGDVIGTAGDPTGDGKVDMKDVLYIARYKANLEDEP